MERMAEKGRNAGFTLIEIMMALLISAIVLTALISVFSNQQKTFYQQSELARSQALARAALYMMARDIRMAGYTGIPLGIDEFTLAGQMYPAQSVIDSGTVVDGLTPAKTLGGVLKSLTGTTDVIEVWGNFQRATTTLQDPVTNATDTKFKVKNLVPFSGDDFNRPGFVVIGNPAKRGGWRVHQITTVDAVAGATVSGDINISGPVGAIYEYPDSVVVAPIFRRAYYVDLTRVIDGRTVPTLFVRNCLNKVCTNPGTDCFDEELARGVVDLEIDYDMAVTDGAELMNDQVIRNQNEICDPCLLRAVNLTIGTSDSTLRRGYNPIEREFSTAVRVRNTGFETISCQVKACP